MKTFLEPLQELEEMRLLREALTKNKKIYDVSGCIDVQKAHLIYGIGEGSPFRLIVTFDEMKAKQLLEEYRFFDPDTVYYPAKDLLFYQSDIRGNCPDQTAHGGGARGAGAAGSYGYYHH